MIIKKVSLRNFRSHENFLLALEKNTTKIVGENGTGKTSILEAIYEALQGKSFRAVDREILRRGAEFYRVELEYVDGQKTVVVYDGEKKEFLVEDKKTRRLPKKNRYPLILFEPADLNLVGASPSRRRTYFDRAFGQLSETYSVALSRYEKALKQRNELLKQDLVDAGSLFPWDVMLAKYGQEVYNGRQKLTQRINQELTATYRSIAENEDEVEVRYDTAVETESSFLRQLTQDFEKDRMLGHTSFGVHRDNYEFVFNQALADGSASRGEVRSLVLALKFIEASLVVGILGQKPVILLDDVFSELDETRQRCLVKNFVENQVILTSVVSGNLVDCVVLRK